jgi:hypothetical protein
MDLVGYEVLVNGAKAGEKKKAIPEGTAFW